MSENEGLEATQAEVVEAPKEEKMLSVSRVNEIVKREKAAVAERVRQELEAKHAEALAQLKQSAGPETTANPENLDVDQMSQKVYDRIAQEVAKHQEEAKQAEHQKGMEEVANKYFLKMGKGKELFEDFDDVMGDFEPASFPQVVFLAADLENTPAIMYELSKNPQKLAAIHAMAKDSPVMAKKMLQQLSESIQKNEQAKAENISTPAPVSRLKSSKVGTDTGQMTIKDMRKLPWLKG